MPQVIEVIGQGMVEFPDSMSEADILAVLRRESAAFNTARRNAPGVPKPGLPDNMPPPFGGDYGAELPIPADNFMTRGVDRIKGGVRRMGSPGMDAKLGGVSDVVRGTGEALSPVLVGAAALPLVTAGSVPAALGYAGTLAAGFGGGYLGAKAARGVAEMADAGEGTKDFAEDVGGLIGGSVAGFGAQSPKVRGAMTGAAKAVPDAVRKSAPFGVSGVALHRFMPGGLAFAADAAAALTAMPPIVRGAMAGAAEKPWLSPGPPSLFPTPKVKRAEPAWRGLMDNAAEEMPAPVTEVPLATPSGRKPGGIFNQTRPPTPEELIARDAEAKRNIDAFMAKKAAATTAEPSGKSATTPESKPKASGLLADAEAEAKRGAWNRNAGNRGEELTKLKQDALISFANANKLPMVDLTEPDYNALVTAFNATKPKHPISGKPWNVGVAGSKFSATGFGRDVETTLRHFNNARLRGNQ